MKSKPSRRPAASHRFDAMALVGLVALTALAWLGPRIDVPDGLHGRYFANPTGTGAPVAERIDTDLSMATLQAQPALNGLTAFSVEWSGAFVARTTGLHRLAAKSDDGTWLWIDDRLVIDNGGTHPTRNVSADVLLERGMHSIRVRYAQDGGESFLQLGQASQDGQFLKLGPLVPTMMSYAELRARELWPLTLVLLWYVAIVRALWIGARQLAPLPHAQAVAGALGDRTFLVVALVSVVASAAHVAYGLPAYDSLSGDELAPLGTLLASYDSFRDWNLRWPTMHMHLIALVLQPFAWASALFGLSMADATVHALMFLAIRGLSLAMLFATLLLTFDATIEVADRAAGHFAVALLGSMPVVVYFGSLANLEAPQLFWGTAAFWTWIKFVRLRDLASAIVFGVVVGLSLATKDQLYGFYVAAPLAVLYVVARDRSEQRRRGIGLIADPRLAAIGLATVLGFAVGHQLPAEWDRFVAHLKSMTTVDSVPFRVFSHTLAGHAGLLIATVKSFVWAAGWPAAVAFAGGCVYLASSGRLRLLASLLLPLATYYVCFLAVILYIYDRFLIAFLPVAAIVGGMFLRAVAGAVWMPRVARVAIPVALFAVAAVSAVGINVVMSADPRTVGQAWMSRHVACGSSVGVTYSAAYVPPLDCYSVWPLLPSRLDGMVRWPEYIVLNEAYSRRFLATASGPRFLTRLRSGELGYERVLYATNRPPRWAPLFWEARFWNGEEDAETILDKPLHGIEVWRLRQ